MSFAIITQFMLQTGLLIVVALLFIPIISEMIFSTNLFSNVSAETLAHRDALWKWTIIIFIGAMAGNVVWFVRVLQSQQSNTVDI